MDSGNLHYRWELSYSVSGIGTNVLNTIFLHAQMDSSFKPQTPELT